jgi:glycerate kinase
VQLLVAPAAFPGDLRASAVAAAIGRGLEAAGLEPPDLCPVADGGEGTLEVLLTRLGGETAGARVAGPDGRPRSVGFGLLEGGATALVEAAAPTAGPAAPDPGAGSRGAGELILAARDAGAEVVVVAAGGRVPADGGAGAIAAIEAGGGLGGVRLIVLCDVGTPSEVAAEPEAAGPGGGGGVRAKPLRKRSTGAGGGLAGGLGAAFGADLRPGAAFVLDALDFDRRMRAAWAVVAGAGRLDRSALGGGVLGEVATRARQAGVPAHAIVGISALDRFDARILDLQEILTARGPAELVAAGGELARRLAGPARRSGTLNH